MPLCLPAPSRAHQLAFGLLLASALAGCGGGGSSSSASAATTPPVVTTTSDTSTAARVATPPASSAAAPAPAPTASAAVHASDDASTPSPIDAVDSPESREVAARLAAQADRAAETDGGAVKAAPAGANLCSVDLYGDSIMYGGYDGTYRMQEPPAAALARIRPAYKVVDWSHNGDSVKLHRSAFADEKRSGRIVVMQWGINDMAHNNLLMPLQLIELIEIAKFEGRSVVVTGLSRQSPPIGARDNWDSMVHSAAKITHSTFAEWGRVPIQAGDTLDGVHPEKGYSDLLVLQLAFALDKIAPECSGAPIPGQ